MPVVLMNTAVDTISTQFMGWMLFDMALLAFQMLPALLTEALHSRRRKIAHANHGRVDLAGLRCEGDSRQVSETFGVSSPATRPTWTHISTSTPGRYGSPDQASNEPLGETIRVMKSSGFRKLGFAIVRGTSDDQGAWDRLVARIRQNAFNYLDIRQELLGHFLDFPVLEGSDSGEQRVALNLDEACAVFEQWSRN